MYRIVLPGIESEVNVGKIVCIGRNYAKHAAEMGGDVPPKPWVFLKPSSALISSGGQIILPAMSSDVHHEVELVAAIAKTAKDIKPEKAMDVVAAYAVGLDMTARDLQAAAKEARSPWSVAKGFDTFAPLGAFVPASNVPDPQALSIQLRVNGELRQDGTTADMIFSVAELVAYCSNCFTLEQGDLLFTGTPEGVGPVFKGDELTASVEGLPELSVSVAGYSE